MSGEKETLGFNVQGSRGRTMPANPTMEYLTATAPQGTKMADMENLVASLAYYIESNFDPSAEKSAGLRKLLEAKDCFTRVIQDGE